MNNAKTKVANAPVMKTKTPPVEYVKRTEAQRQKEMWSSGQAIRLIREPFHVQQTSVWFSLEKFLSGINPSWPMLPNPNSTKDFESAT